MQEIEYHNTDKKSWGLGPWQQEPDKAQWQDAATGLPCLIVRNHSGAWCGYVGVSEGHPLFGKDYGACSPQAVLEAHGGITFTSFCSETDEATWKRWQESITRHKAEAEKYPQGDAARWLREWGPVLSDYASWKARFQSVGICHIPSAGEPERVWWFGFDCSHAGDLCPSYESRSLREYGTYKDIGYVKSEVASLAKQLAAIR